jgi:hypothetical protein
MALARLIITSGNRKGEEIELGADRVTLGRLAISDVAIPDSKASRAHARIFRSGTAFTIADLESRNGTLVNDRRVSRVRLHDGDRITIGTTEILFREEASSGGGAPGSAAAGPSPTVRPDSPSEPPPLGGEPRRAFARDARPEDIELRSAPLQFSRYKDDRTSSLLRYDIAQGGGGFRLLAVVVGILVLAAAAVVAAWLTAGF